MPRISEECFVSMQMMFFLFYYWVLVLRAVRFWKGILEILVAYRTQSRPPSTSKSFFSSHDVTLVVPTIDTDDKFSAALSSWLSCNPAEIIIVTTEQLRPKLEIIISQMIGTTKIRICTQPVPGKRALMIQGVLQTRTRILVFVDDDVLFSPQSLEGLLSGFNDPEVGAIDTQQRVLASTLGKPLTLWETCAAARSSRRNIINATCAHFNNGQPINITGRCAAYRTSILVDPTLRTHFLEDFWRQKYHLKSGDGDFLTTWVAQRGWKTYHQTGLEFEIATHVKPDWTYLRQLLRWSRNFARYFCRDVRFTVTQGRPRDYKRILLDILSVYLTDLSIWCECLMVCVLLSALICGQELSLLSSPLSTIYISILSTLALEILENLTFLTQSPRRLHYIPLIAVYGYVRAFVVLFAVFTLYKTGWGTRPAADA